MAKRIKVPEDFKPSARVYELAEENNITIDFVNSQVKEFIFYFQEKETKYVSWQQTYWNWVKRGWGWKKERSEKQVRTSPSSNQEFIGYPKRKVSDKETAKERIKQLRRSIHGNPCTSG